MTTYNISFPKFNGLFQNHLFQTAFFQSLALKHSLLLILTWLHSLFFRFKATNLQKSQHLNSQMSCTSPSTKECTVKNNSRDCVCSPRIKITSDIGPLDCYHRWYVQDRQHPISVDNEGPLQESNTGTEPQSSGRDTACITESTRRGRRQQREQNEEEAVVIGEWMGKENTTSHY